MSLQNLQPVIPSFRHYRKIVSRDVFTENSPEKSLVKGIKRSKGRNNQGKITSRHRGGGHKKNYRLIDFKRNKLEVPGRIASIEYDPFRSAHISLVVYADGEKRYILSPAGIKVDDKIVSSNKAEIRLGNTLPLRNIPMGTVIHNIELTPGQGGAIVRSAGSSAQLLGKEGKYAQIRLPSGEVRKVLLDCFATIGVVSNEMHGNISLGKAGRKRNMGFRPKVRGIAMSPKDHPHGGGEGASSIGMPSPKSPWGWKTLGRKTRRNKSTSKFIIRSRKKKRK